ncbi:MAG TPA: ferrous iron transport protein A [Candidatus Faecivicinus avistercoris]|mgnify:FL=1|nr:ferrous iron transport protein A [Candidatus Faecivicinus avistercoris]
MEETGRSLQSLADGQSGVVERIALTGATKRRLIEMGITPGTRVGVLKRAPLGDPIEILLRGYSLTIRGTDAAQIFVGEVRP